MKFIRNLVKELLGPPVYYSNRLLRSSLAHQEIKRLQKELASCGASLDIAYPWDIRWAPYIHIGNDVFIGPRVVLIATTGAEIHIGDKVMFGPEVTMVANDHRYDVRSVAIRDSGFVDKTGIRICDDVWIGSGAIVLKGVTIGRGSIIGAGAVITRDVGENEIWAGNPARKIKDRFAALAAAQASERSG